jgi:hypothetical protein
MIENASVSVHGCRSVRMPSQYQQSSSQWYGKLLLNISIISVQTNNCYKFYLLNFALSENTW